MFEYSEYQHPQLEPFSSGSWTEVAFSWVIGVTAVSAMVFIL